MTALEHYEHAIEAYSKHPIYFDDNPVKIFDKKLAEMVEKKRHFSLPNEIEVHLMMVKQFPVFACADVNSLYNLYQEWTKQKNIFLR